MAPIQNSRISAVKIAFKDSGAVTNSHAAVNIERKLIRTRSAFTIRIKRKAINETERKIIDPLFCKGIDPALNPGFCRYEDVPFSVFKLVWLSVNVSQGWEIIDNL